MILWHELQWQLEPSGKCREFSKEFSITHPRGAEDATKSATTILSNFYIVKQRLTSPKTYASFRECCDL
jgi:hypothetical protein